MCRRSHDVSLNQRYTEVYNLEKMKYDRIIGSEFDMLRDVKQRLNSIIVEK